MNDDPYSSIDVKMMEGYYPPTEEEIEEMQRKFIEKMDQLPERAPTKFDMLLKEYEKKFGEWAPTEPSCWTEEDWCEILEECIKQSVTLKEMFGGDEMEDDDDVDDGW